MRAALEDGEWEKNVVDDSTSNDIRIKVVNGQITVTKGAGMPLQKMVVCSDGVPAIATKTVRPEDVYNVSSIYR